VADTSPPEMGVDQYLGFSFNQTTTSVVIKESKMKKAILVVAIIGAFLSAGAEAQTIRATDIPGLQWEKLMTNAKGNLTVEFRKGDELPVAFRASGDLFETSREGVSYIIVKRTFWLKMNGSEVQMSLDGSSYKNLNETVGGSFSARAGSGDEDGIAHAINLVLEANLKE